jgi:hypothetical protein
MDSLHLSRPATESAVALATHVCEINTERTIETYRRVNELEGTIDPDLGQDL